MGRIVDGVVVWSSSAVLSALRGDRFAVGRAMSWDTTPQGWSHWKSRKEGRAALTDDDRAFLRGLLTDEDRAAWDASEDAKRVTDIMGAERAVIAAALAWRDDQRSELAANVLAAECARLAALREAKVTHEQMDRVIRILDAVADGITVRGRDGAGASWGRVMEAMTGDTYADDVEELRALARAVVDLRYGRKAGGRGAA